MQTKAMDKISLPSLSSYLYADEAEVVEELLGILPWNEARAQEVQKSAIELVEQIRARKRSPGQLESFLQQYSLNTDEGLALMCLAEALLRVPDRATADALIKDKVAAANWLDAAGDTKDWIVKAAGVGLLMSRHMLSSKLSHISQAVIREAMVKAMRVMGAQFVLGRSIEEAKKNMKPYAKKGYRPSYDMLGEGARTAEDAERYFLSYMEAIDAIGAGLSKDDHPRPGISVKLSALHPRYEYAQRDKCVPDLTTKLVELCKRAASYDITLTVDAEEVERLELSLEIIDSALSRRIPKEWKGFGMAVQAYQKRCFALIDHIAELSQRHGRVIQVRLVKGAYWDTEIKRAQVMGLREYPVFTRKSNTDLSYLACAAKLFSYKDYIFPMFGTHNAHTVAAVITMAEEADAEYEFQRLHGMGDSLFGALKDGAVKGLKDVPVTIYAPVGSHEDLLPYLVRRLLENGANTSFVNQILNPDEPAEKVVGDPVIKIKNRLGIRHSKIPLPSDLYAQEAPRGRTNSRGLDLTEPEVVHDLIEAINGSRVPYEAMPLIGGKIYKDSVPEEVKNPANEQDNMGLVWPAGKGLVDKAFRVAGEGFADWSQRDARDRARALERFADLLEDHTGELIALCCREAGRTLQDGIDEVREAVDFCRYYANKGRELFATGGEVLPGPTGEHNALSLHGRGVFVCISPWNFPLAIFTGQIAAAVMAGNSVLAKPAEQTPMVAMRAVRLMHQAGIPENVVNLVTGAGDVGARLIGHKDVAGVCFTGSTEVAREINKTLAAKDGPIVPLIAETGGQNTMIVDSSALPEQVVDDVVLSAFGSAGQRCSALRILCLQDDIADKVIAMLAGAMEQLQIGDPSRIETDVGPVIDEDAYAMLMKHRTSLEGFGRLIAEVKVDEKLSRRGHFIAPCAFEIEGIEDLKREVFGPILHVVRFKRKELGELIDSINGTGYGLTFGVHSRIEAFQEEVAARVHAGNVYVNRSMIGAVVGVQPFGGHGLSGTGPKAGGPHYLPRFALEKTTSIDTTAAGGNASLLSIKDN